MIIIGKIFKNLFDNNPDISHIIINESDFVE